MSLCVTNLASCLVGGVVLVFHTWLVAVGLMGVLVAKNLLLIALSLLLSFQSWYFLYITMILVPSAPVVAATNIQ